MIIKIQTFIASIGLNSHQKRLIKKLSRYKKTFMQELGEVIWENEDYAQANMHSPALGLSVLKRQAKTKEMHKKQKEKLAFICRKNKIATWRIKLVS